MHRSIFVSLCIFVVLLLNACGGGSAGDRSSAGHADEEDKDLGVKMTAEDMVPRGALTRADFTTEVDSKRYRAIAPISNEFSAKEKIIYMVGRLKNVPTDSTIEVRWFLDALSEPLLISRVQGSESFQFVASFQPTEKKFQRGSYTARVYVNDAEAGAETFSIYDKDMESRGVRVGWIELSKKINKKQKAVQPADFFKRGTDKVFVSFNVTGADMGVVAEVRWLRGSEAFHSEDVTLIGDKTYSAYISSSGGLPDGDYAVQVLVYDNVEATKKFVIGKKSNGPSIDEISLGIQLKGNNMPAQPRTSFSKDAKVIQCGIRFMDLPADSVIDINWIQIDEEGETVRYANRSNLSSGGSGTMGAAWELKYELDPGDYKALVLVNGEPMGEQAFKIE